MSAPSVEGAHGRRHHPRRARPLARGPIPGARLCELPGADHLWWLPEPSAIADLITDFTEEHSR